ncbi:serine hydrolase domain-containing protein [Chitinophaga flava]|nr:serine hydrolase domain-containing protein [Chitinophaga flava]
MMRNLCLAILLAFVASSCKKNKDEVVPKEPLKTAAVSQQVDKLINDIKIPGVAVALVGPDGIVWSKTAGMANLEKKEAVTDKTVFKLGSVAKPFIAFSVMKLVEQGKLNLDANVNDYLPFTVQNPKNPGKKITLRTLLSHTSGIIDTAYERHLAEDFVVTERDHPAPISEYIRSMLEPTGKYYSPDSFLDDREKAVYSYSNVGAALAAYIVELTAKENFDTWTTRQFIAPLNTTTLTWHLRDFASQPYAVPYGPALQPWGKYSMVDYCTGGLHSNLTDLATFARMLVNNGNVNGKQIISASSLDAMGQVQYPDIKSTQGLFWERYKLDNRPIFGHSGDVWGSHSLLYINPENKRAAIILYNRDLEDDQRPEINKLLQLLLTL